MFNTFHVLDCISKNDSICVLSHSTYIVAAFKVCCMSCLRDDVYKTFAYFALLYYVIYKLHTSYADASHCDAGNTNANGIKLLHKYIKLKILKM